MYDFKRYEVNELRRFVCRPGLCDANVSACHIERKTGEGEKAESLRMATATRKQEHWLPYTGEQQAAGTPLRQRHMATARKGLIEDTKDPASLHGVSASRRSRAVRTGAA
jgi:hypothetical protein